MHCQSVQNQLSFFAHGELDETVQSQIAAHLESCKACRQALAEYRQLGELSKALQPAPISEVETEQMEAALITKMTERPSARWRWFANTQNRALLPRLAASLAMLTVIIWGVSYWFEETPPAMPEKRSLESFLASSDYYALYLALQNPVEKQRLYSDSISVTVLLETIERYDQLRKKYGRMRTSSAALVPLFVPDTQQAWQRFLEKLRLNQLPPSMIERIKRVVTQMRTTHQKITPDALLRKLASSRVLFRR